MGQFVWWRCKASRRGSTLHVHTPTLIMLLASILVNIQPMGILVIGSWKLCCGHCESFFPGNDAFHLPAVVRRHCPGVCGSWRQRLLGCELLHGPEVRRVSISGVRLGDPSLLHMGRFCVHVH